MSRLPALLLAPIVLAQARRVSASTPRMPEPEGEREGVAAGEPRDGASPASAPADAPVARLLVLGDSTAVGTGAASIAGGLAPRLAAELAARQSAPVAWRVLGRNGLTAAEVRAELLPAALDDPADLVVVVVGWNDALRLRSGRAFARDLAALVREPAARRLGRRVVVVGAPRFDRFEVLPQPLRRALGTHAAGLRRAAARVCATWGATLAPGFDGATTASDRFHPDEAGYARMAGGIVAALRR